MAVMTGSAQREAIPPRADQNARTTLVAIDDEIQNLELISSILGRDGLEILTETDPERGLELVLRKHPQVVLVDLMMPKLGGMELLSRIVEACPDIDVILMTGHYSTESAVEAIQKGACDYLEKPLSVERLRQRVDKFVEAAHQRRQYLHLEKELLNASQFEGIVGCSHRMLEVFARIRRVAPHFRTVAVMGDTGTGKELVARALHKLSPVASGPFAVCNCSAIVETLFESELFGHVKDLDEIGDMPLVTQAKILRVLQSQEIQRVGSPVVRKVDVRVIAATNRDLQALVKEKQFREDLFYRLSTVEIKLPRLEERKEDLPLLERYFLEHFSSEYRKPYRSLTQPAEALLARYNWPGNVRELENALGNACMMAEGDTIDVRDLPVSLKSSLSQESADADMPTLEEFERRYVQRILERVEGNKSRATEILGIGRTTLYRLLNKIEAESASETDSRR